MEVSKRGLDLRSARDAGRDPDHDGLTNLTEYRFGTNPLVPQTQTGTTDRSRFNRHGSTTVTSIPGGGGLMSRYRAQIAADLGQSTYRSFGLVATRGGDTPTPPPGGGGEGPSFTMTVTRTYSPSGRETDFGDCGIPGRLNSGNASPGSHPCGRIRCSECTGGYNDCDECDDGKLDCPGNHMTNCPPKVKGACPGGHKKKCTGGSHTFRCQQLHFTSASELTCTVEEHTHTEECQSNDCSKQEHTHTEACRENVEVEQTHEEAGCGDGSLCGPDCPIMVDTDECLDPETCTLRPDEDCPTCMGTGYRPLPCTNMCVRPDCPKCEDGKIRCTNPDCDYGDLKMCACGRSDCNCFGENDPCPEKKPDGEEWSETGIVSIVYNDEADNSIWNVTVDGSVVGLLSPDNQSVSVTESGGGLGVTVNVEMIMTGEDAQEPTDGKTEVNVSDAAGPRYRKIGFNGLPLADSKPQEQDESGGNPEETYIDAYNRQLRHSVSDVYGTVEGSLLPLMVRRDLAPEIWTRKAGLRPAEKPFLPFGAGWSSNLCSYIKFERQGDSDPPMTTSIEAFAQWASSATLPDVRATVVDEQGASATYLQKGGSNWVHSGEEQLDAKTAKNVFNGSMLFKKFGATCFYEDAGINQIIAGSRVGGESGGVTVTRYSRLLEVRDRLGNRLKYNYGGPGTLIPNCIYDPDRPGRFIQIVQEDGHVTSVRGPGGQTISYHYEGLCLESVNHSGTTVQYQYEEMHEPDEDGNVDPDYMYNHINVCGMIDELGRTFMFHRDFDHSRLTLDGRIKPGQPRVISALTSPGGTIWLGAAWSGSGGGVSNHSMSVGDTLYCANSAIRTCTGLDGATTTYTFSDPHVFDARFANNMGAERANAITLTYKTMSVTRSKGELSLGTETYVYNPNASMGLASATDLSGNTTTYTYGTDGYDDPITEVDALGNTKSFTYDSDTRIMTSMTDALGTMRAYGIETREVDGMAVKGLKVSEVVSNNNVVLRSTHYDYDHPTFHGLVTKQWTLSPNEGAMPSSVTITSLAAAPAGGWQSGDTWMDHLEQLRSDSAGSQGPNHGWWYEITQTTGKADAQGGLAAALTSSTTVHDFSGAKRSVIDGRNLLTNFNYDAAGRLIGVAFPDGSTKCLSYDDHGNVIQETNENGVSAFHEYDYFNRRIKSTVDLNGNGKADAAYTVVDVSGDRPVYDGDIVKSTVYNARNQITLQTDPRGRVTTNEYDDFGRLISTNVAGLVTDFFYDGVNNGGSVFDTSAIKPNRTTDPRGVVTTVVYDKLYRPVSFTVAAPGITSVTLTKYDPLGKPLEVTDPLGRVTLNTYDGLGQLIKVTEPDLTTDATDNPTVVTSYTHQGKPWRLTDQNGHVTETTYDALGRPVKITSPEVDGVSAITTTEYDAAGNAVRVTDAMGRETETVYDDRNRPVAVTAPTVWDGTTGKFARPTTTTTYDNLGQVLTVTDPMGAVTTTHYDPAGRKWKVEVPAPEQGAARPVTVTTFDAGGLALTVTNPLNQTVTNTYDIHERLISTVDAENITNSFSYDAAGNRLSVTDGKNQTTTFVYDGLNRLTSQTFANGDTWTHQYNAIQKLSQTSPRGIVTSYAYNACDRLMSVSAPAHGSTPAIDRAYTYDLAGRLLTVTEADHSAAEVSYTYDAMGRVTAETSRGQMHQYAYDLAGNRIQATYSTGRVVETSYDGLNRPEVISEGGLSTRYGYDKAGRAIVLVAGNGQTSSNTYDALGRLQDRTLFRTFAMSEADVQAEFSWEHDALGNVLAQHETWPGEASRQGSIRSTVMTYDHNNRLLMETIQTRSGATSTPVDQSSTAYTYDDANNRSSKTVTRIAAAASSAAAGENEVGHWEYTYNSANQLTAWEKWDEPNGTWQKSAVLSYDDAGNRNGQTVDHIGSSIAVETTSYTWDAQDRLLGVTLPDSSEHSYEYDYRTRRIGTSSSTPEGNTTVTKHTAIVFSGGLSVAEWEAQNSVPTAANPPTVEYTRGPDMGGGVGGLLYSLRGESGTGTQSNPVAKYNLSNGRGDIVAQSNPSATLTWTASYEAYGKRTKETGENQDKQRGNSKDEDPTGLLNEGFRYRDLETGVWLSRDPAGFVDGPNVYAYVKQNPWSGFDPKGLAEKRVTAIGHEVKGKGHHLNPVELWDKQGFTDKGAHEIFDKATVAAPEHNFTAHGSKTGYTAQVEGEFNAFKQDWASKNKTTTTVGEMSAKQQQQLAQEFVDHIKPGGTTSNGYIKGFNEVVGKGPAEVAKWEATAGKSLFKPLVASETAFVAASGRKIPYLSYAGRAVSKVAVVGSVVLGAAAVAHAGQTEGSKGALIESSYQLGSIATMGATDLCRAVGEVQSWHMEESKETQSAGFDSYFGWMGNFTMW